MLNSRFFREKLNSRFFREKYQIHFKLLFYILPSMLSNNYIPELLTEVLFVCVEVSWPSQPYGVMSSMVSLPNHTLTGQA